MNASDLPTDQSARRDFLRRHSAPEFVRLVTEAQARPVDYILVSVRGFDGEPDVLYVALNYARVAGVSILLVSDDASEGRSTKPV